MRFNLGERSQRPKWIIDRRLCDLGAKGRIKISNNKILIVYL